MGTAQGFEERCHEILERKGGRIADKARSVLQEDPPLGLEDPSQYVSRYWRDPLTPALLVLSSEAIEGRRLNYDVVDQAALGMTVLSLGLNLWDDIVDTTMQRGLVPTVLGKYGQGITLILGGLATAKAFSILNRMKVSQIDEKRIDANIWNYCKRLAEAETLNLSLRNQSDVLPDAKLRVIEMQSINLETASKIGALIGNGSEEEIECLGKYGQDLSIILELMKDVEVTLNFTLDLVHKVRSRAMTYTLSYAKSCSERVRKSLVALKDVDDAQAIRELVTDILETGAVEHTYSIIVEKTKKAKENVMKLPENESIRSLAFLADAQPNILSKRIGLAC